jgi:hypothetical protein
MIFAQSISNSSLNKLYLLSSDVDLLGVNITCCQDKEFIYGPNIGCIGIINTPGLIDFLNAFTGVCFIEVTSKTIDHFFINGQTFKMVFSVS